jgi:dihydroneopterin aldolase
MTNEWPLSEALGLRRLLDRAATSTYRIVVRDLVLPCSIGIYDYERRQRQRVRFNVEIDIADPGAFPDRDLARILNYESVLDGIRSIAESGHVDLVETLAERIAALCLEDPRALRAMVGVEKLDICPEANGVGVSIVRRREPADGAALRP